MQKDLPRCNKCEYCRFGKSNKNKGYTYFCTITGNDVGQSHFGQNSPRTCPRRKAKTNQNKENNMQKKLKEIKPGEVFTYANYDWIKLEEEGL